MKCEMCGRDPDFIVLLPRKQPDGKLVTFACEGCSVESGMYCQKHGRPHIWFEDETTACLLCIENIVEKDGERIAGIFAATVLSGVSLAELPLAVRFLGTPHALNIARLVVTYSQRMKITPEEVIKRVAKEGVGVVLPPEFTEEV